MTIREIQDSIISSKVKVKRQSDSLKMQRTQPWKTVILEGFYSEFLDKALLNMANVDPDIRASARSQVLGVGVLKSYIEGLESESSIAELSIESAESELSRIRGEV